VTLFGIFLTPVFYYVIQWFNDLRMKQPAVLLEPRVGRHGVAVAHVSGNGALVASSLAEEHNGSRE
jgi:hypothetical protein